MLSQTLVQLTGRINTVDAFTATAIESQTEDFPDPRCSASNSATDISSTTSILVLPCPIPSFQHAKIEHADSHPDRIRDSSFDLLPQKSVEPILRAATYPDSRHRRVATYWEMEILTGRLNEATDNEDDTLTILVPAGVTGPFVC
jgi:hypothetical protein